ncbi:MAG: hypothetical protein JSR99_04145 [Proteobacteria bacterium]|nr:hypothetical protein [Pseudomonadota bacterium]
MCRTFSHLLSLPIGALVLAIFAGAAGAESFTTRIETKPYYGAIVTLEHGVRVYRPLPPDRQVIINPDRVPLNLSYSDTRVYSYRAGANYAGRGVAGAGFYDDGDGIYYAPVGGPFGNRGRFHGPGRGHVFQWHPGFYHIGAAGAPVFRAPNGFHGPAGAIPGNPGAVGAGH